MGEARITELDRAKKVFEVLGAAVDGTVLFRRKVPRGQVVKFFASQPSCRVAIEGCAGPHH